MNAHPEGRAFIGARMYSPPLTVRTEVLAIDDVCELRGAQHFRVYHRLSILTDAST